MQLRFPSVFPSCPHASQPLRRVHRLSLAVTLLSFPFIDHYAPRSILSRADSTHVQPCSDHLRPGTPLLRVDRPLHALRGVFREPVRESTASTAHFTTPKPAATTSPRESSIHFACRSAPLTWCSKQLTRISTAVHSFALRQKKRTLLVEGVSTNNVRFSRPTAVSRYRCPSPFLNGTGGANSITSSGRSSEPASTITVVRTRPFQARMRTFSSSAS